MLLVVILNISVLNATVFTRLAVVIFVLMVDLPQSSLSLPSPCLPSPSPYHLSLPTLVRVNRLEFLLSGYNHSIAEFLSRGFREGFPLHICFQPWITQRCLMPSLTRNVRLVVWRALFISLPFIHLEFLPKVSCLRKPLGNLG